MKKPTELKKDQVRNLILQYADATDEMNSHPRGQDMWMQAMRRRNHAYEQIQQLTGLSMTKMEIMLNDGISWQMFWDMKAAARVS